MTDFIQLTTDFKKTFHKNSPMVAQLLDSDL